MTAGSAIQIAQRASYAQGRRGWLAVAVCLILFRRFATVPWEPSDLTTTVQWSQKPSYTTYESKSTPIQRDDLVNNRTVDLAHNETVGNLTNRLSNAGLQLSVHTKEMIADVWPKAVKLYYQGGTGPILIGKERCEEFRKRAGEKAAVSVAGLYNSGTNAFLKNMRLNIGTSRTNQVGGLKEEPPWWKHNPKINDPKCGRLRQHETVLPIVIVRDPMFWRKSTCTASYTLSWENSEGGQCPRFWFENGTTTTDDVVGHPVNSIPVTITKKVSRSCTINESYESMVDLWNQFYSAYLDADFPRLIIRAEDALFYTPELIEEVRLCVGGYTKHSYTSHHISTSRAKTHGNNLRRDTGIMDNPYLAALHEATSLEKRSISLSEAELQYTREKLDPRLMSLFRYVLPGDEGK